MRTPAHIQQQARRGLQILQRNPLSVKAVQQPQGLHIVTVTTTSAQLTSASSTGLGLAAAERASWSENFFFRALTQLRDGISSIFPKATVVVTGIFSVYLAVQVSGLMHRERERSTHTHIDIRTHTLSLSLASSFIHF